MTWFLVIVASVLASELLMALPILQAIARVLSFARKAAQLVSSKRISDRWKERIVPVYALHIIRGSLIFLAMLGLVLAPFLVAGLLSGLASDGGLTAWGEMILRPEAMGLIAAVSVGWILLRRKIRQGAARV